MSKGMSKTELAKLLKTVEAVCKDKGARFTDSRRYVLEIIAGAGRPIGAYDILEALGKYVKDPKPPTAYRALEFLTEEGLVHRIESLNAYVLCDMDHRHNGSQFMVCDNCGDVTEAHLCHLPSDLAIRVQAEGFVLSRWDAELHGTCRACAKA
ncbi:MAG: transcriptional repressor [Micavibrio aeruginosavorus]|uniref:Transcriptional repressor n=1 Tax=Micavibrio aeruginosavorus TaxID=349221 RepID=A0A2W5N1Z3_9BACT|nr:MAG: transcriptional repressor [Micavibrio aeruginosavorus]